MEPWKQMIFLLKRKVIFSFHLRLPGGYIRLQPLFVWEIVGGFLKCWVSPTNPWVFPLKMIKTWGGDWGYHHLRKFPQLGNLTNQPEDPSGRYSPVSTHRDHEGAEPPASLPQAAMSW